MKTNSILLLLSVFLLASCAGKYSVMKRRYNKGFYVSASGNAKSQDVKTPKATVRNLAKVSAAEPAPIVNEAVVLASAQPAETMKGKAVAHKATVTRPSKSHAAPVLAGRPAVKDIAPVLQQARKEMKAHKTSADADTNKILLIILALFPILSLIAVYLHDGGVTINFWITLLLHLVFLYWLFALLVVLDVIDLR